MNRLTSASLSLVLSLALSGCADAASDADAVDASAPDVFGEVSASGEATASGALVDPNVADEATLAAIPGMTEELAAAVVGARPFANMLEVDALLGETLDEAAREALYNHVFIKLDLNAASDDEIKLIPGVGDRMAHEFEEYRPYDAIERFRREMGKYVDEAEVARLEQYVEIR